MSFFFFKLVFEVCSWKHRHMKSDFLQESTMQLQHGHRCLCWLSASLQNKKHEVRYENIKTNPVSCASGSSIGQLKNKNKCVAVGLPYCFLRALCEDRTAWSGFRAEGTFACDSTSNLVYLNPTLIMHGHSRKATLF